LFAPCAFVAPPETIKRDREHFIDREISEASCPKLPGKSLLVRRRTTNMASESVEWQEEGYGNEDGVSNQHSDQQVEEFDPESHIAGDDQDDGVEDDGGDYDPESVTLSTPAQLPERQSSSAQPHNPSQAQKPKVSGGFLIEASDDEDEDGTPAQTGSAPPKPSVTPQIAESSNGVPARPSTNPPPALPGLDPKAILEARVKQDPRGDMDAWLELMATHRQSQKLDEIRATYNRFLEVFPQAVGRSPSVRIYIR
jgi:cleavage stimulation factor subunit 3